MADAKNAQERNQRFREVMQARAQGVSELSAAEIDRARARNAAFRAHAKRLSAQATADGAKRRVPRRPS